MDVEKKKLSAEAFITMHTQCNAAENQGSLNLVQLPIAQRVTGKNTKRPQKLENIQIHFKFIYLNHLLFLENCDN